VSLLLRIINAASDISQECAGIRWPCKCPMANSLECYPVRR